MSTLNTTTTTRAVNKATGRDAETIFNHVVSYYKLDEKQVNEIIFAICSVDKIYGDNPRKLSPNLGVLPDVQRLRVYCDALLIALQSQTSISTAESINSLVLTNPQSYKVINSINPNNNSDLKSRTCSDSYADEKTCWGILNKLYATTIDTSGNWEAIKDLEDKLYSYPNFNESIEQEIRERTKHIPIPKPSQLRCIGAEGEAIDTFENTYNLVITKVVESLVVIFIKQINSLCRSKEGSIHANLLVRRILQANNQTSSLNNIGVSSFRYLDTNTSHIPLVVVDKLNKIFSYNKQPQESDIEELMFFIYYTTPSAQLNTTTFTPADFQYQARRDSFTSNIKKGAK